MNKQNFLIGAMAVAIAALGVITYQQQSYIQQLAADQQNSSVSKQIKKLNSRMDDLESQLDNLGIGLTISTASETTSKIWMADLPMSKVLPVQSSTTLTSISMTWKIA